MITKEEFENFIELNEKITTHAAKAINAWQIIKNKDFKCDFASPEDIRFEKDHFYYVYYQYGDEEYEQLEYDCLFVEDYESYLIEKLEDQKRKQKERDEEEKKKRKDLNKLQEAFLKKEEYENYLKLKEKYEGKK